LGNVSENGPDGSTSVTKSGTQQFHDPYTNQTIDIPTFTRNTTLSNAQQAIKTQQDGASLNLASLGNNLSGKLATQLTDNFKLGNEATEGRLFELGRKRLDPMFAERDAALEARLANQGIGMGSKQFDTAMRQNSEGKNDAYNQLLLQGRGQAGNELLTEDNQRINQISALMNGGQVSQPNFMGANMPTIQTTDTAGIIQQDYQNRVGAANQKNAAIQSGLGGLFSLGSSFLYSDERLKENITRIGVANNGLPIYAYNYKAGGPTHIGFLAHEVEQLHPEAVREFDGFKAVDYSKAVLA
jgi:Chaperone of endosialidase